MTAQSKPDSKSARKPLTVERLRELLFYHPPTGVFLWLTKNMSRSPVADCVRDKARDGPNGYITIYIDDASYYAHRLAWLYVHGEWPPRDIDHRDGDKSNNAIDNLRLATDSENIANRGVLRNSASGIKGVFYSKERRRWYARIQKDHIVYSLGRFRTKEDAAEAYRKKAMELYGEFARWD